MLGRCSGGYADDEMLSFLSEPDCMSLAEGLAFFRFTRPFTRSMHLTLPEARVSVRFFLEEAVSRSTSHGMAKGPLSTQTGRPAVYRAPLLVPGKDVSHSHFAWLLVVRQAHLELFGSQPVLI